MPVSFPSPEQVHLRLTVDVLITPESESVERIKKQLDSIVHRAYDNGQITGPGEAVVDEIETRVERIS